MEPLEPLELVAGDGDLVVTVTPVMGVFVVMLANQTPVVLTDVQLAWFPPDQGEVVTRVPSFAVPAMGEKTILVGYTSPAVGTWHLIVLFRSGDGTEVPLVVSRSIVAGDAAPRSLRDPETWSALAPYLTSREVSLPPSCPPGLALQVIMREVARELVPLSRDTLTVVSLDPVVMIRVVLPGKVIISGAKDLRVPDEQLLAARLASVGAIDHHRAYFDLGTAISQLRLFLDMNWYVDETVAAINKVHRVLAALDAPFLLDPLISLLDHRETLKDLTATERQAFDKALHDLEMLMCPK